MRTPPPPYDPPMTLGIGLRQGPWGEGGGISEVPLHREVEEGIHCRARRKHLGFPRRSLSLECHWAFLQVCCSQLGVVRVSLSSLSVARSLCLSLSLAASEKVSGLSQLVSVALSLALSQLVSVALSQLVSVLTQVGWAGGLDPGVLRREERPRRRGGCAPGGGRGYCVQEQSGGRVCTSRAVRERECVRERDGVYVRESVCVKETGRVCVRVCARECARRPGWGVWRVRVGGRWLAVTVALVTFGGW